MIPQGQTILPVNDLDVAEIDDRSTKRILVVEDDYPILEALAEILDEEGYIVSTANNGREALDHLTRNSAPNLIILDLRMPVMDGWTFRNVQKMTSNLAPIPVVAISADGSAPAQAISADAFLRKPLDMGELLRTVRRVLSEDERKRELSYRTNIEHLASLGRVAAGVGHEINNPLAFVLMNVELASARLHEISQGAGPPGSPGLDISEHEAAELATLLTDSLVGLERIRTTVKHLQILSRRCDEKREPVDLERVMDKSIAIALNQIQHRARLTKHYNRVPPVNGNAEELGQVFLNLLINSAHAIPEGNAQGNSIDVVTTHDGTNVFVEIADTGHGVAADILPKIFDPFVSTKSTEEGAGLGLAICQRIVTDHGGRLTIESEVGRGSTCRLRLPAFETKPEGLHQDPRKEKNNILPLPAATSASLTVVSGVRGRILVIDDELMIGKVITRTLSKRHDVVAFQNAKDAFATLARNHDYDLVLCDLIMPNIGGSRVFEVFATRWPDLVSKLVFMTGGVFSEEASAFLQRAQRPILGKPFTPTDLEALVNAHVAKEGRLVPS